MLNLQNLLSPHLGGILQGLKLHHGLDDLVPLKADNPLDLADDAGDLVDHLHVDGILIVGHGDEEDVIGRDLLVLSLKEAVHTGVVGLNTTKISNSRLQI